MLNIFAVIEAPAAIAPEELDAYLERGWFRMNQTIFTTHFLHFKGRYYSAIWLRLALAGYVQDSRHITLLQRNKAFTVEIQPAIITEAHNSLYEKYKTGVAFDAYSSLNQLLLSGRTENIFNTWQVNIYDAGALIACGFFDLGKTSAEGIVSIYHPGYKKYSLGKYLIYNKIDYCRKLGLQYFYPGYAVPGYKAFDYKLDIGGNAIQYYNIATSQWVPYTTVHEMYNPLAAMYEKLETIKQALSEKYIDSTLLYYKFFDCGLNIRFWGELLDYPIFLLPGIIKKDHTAMPIIIYNITNSRYTLIECTPVYKIADIVTDENTFATDILCIDRYVYDTPYLEKMLAVLAWNDKQGQ